TATISNESGFYIFQSQLQQLLANESGFSACQLQQPSQAPTTESGIIFNFTEHKIAPLCKRKGIKDKESELPNLATRNNILFYE
ncbi:1053_t:CDS:1, partial [Ambispora leptoticha]